MNLREILSKRLTKKEVILLPRAYDVIGNIAIIDIPIELKKREKLIAKTLLEHKNIKTVLKKVGRFKGRLRTRSLCWIAGEKTRETIHRESYTNMGLDVETCYFSPRLSNDRLEIARQIKSGEKVLVMFAGVGPYPLVLAKNSRAKIIYAIEINRKASKYAQANILLNKLNNVFFIQGNVKKQVPELVKKVGKFDRIVMARPQLKDMFLDSAFLASKKGTIINLHDFVKSEDMPNLTLKKIEDAVKSSKKIKKYKLLGWKKAGDIGPGKFRIRVDFVVFT